MNSDILYNVLEVAVIVICALVSRFLIPWFNSMAQDTRVSTVIRLCGELVKGAEQKYTEPKSGEIKKEEVTDLISAYCKAHKISLTEEQISGLIESAVYGFNAAKKAAAEQAA